MIENKTNELNSANNNDNNPVKLKSINGNNNKSDTDDGGDDINNEKSNLNPESVIESTSTSQTMTKPTKLKKQNNNQFKSNLNNLRYDHFRNPHPLDFNYIHNSYMKQISNIPSQILQQQYPTFTNTIGTAPPPPMPPSSYFCLPSKSRSSVPHPAPPLPGYFYDTGHFLTNSFAINNNPKHDYSNRRSYIQAKRAQVSIKFLKLNAC